MPAITGCLQPDWRWLYFDGQPRPGNFSEGKQSGDAERETPRRRRMLVPKEGPISSCFRLPAYYMPRR
jgi:hypothetical protein